MSLSNGMGFAGFKGMYINWKNHDFLKGLLSIFFFVFLLRSAFPHDVHALDRNSEFEQSRSLSLWGENLNYQFILKNDPNVKFDGEAFIRKEKGQKINYVVINTAFFRKEAVELFDRFQQNRINHALPSMDNLKMLEKTLLSLKSASPKNEGFSPIIFADLTNLQLAFEELAWYGLFQNCLHSTSSNAEALNLFAKSFERIRIDTIERHEASHLLDIKLAREFDTKEFDRKTELNAFYAELVYGNNPKDVMAQAIAGFLDELKKGKTVDHSVEKVATILHFIKECPRFSKGFQGPMGKCCLEVLAKLKPNDFILIGKSLYQKNQNLPLYASLQ